MIEPIMVNPSIYMSVLMLPQHGFDFARLDLLTVSCDEVKMGFSTLERIGHSVFDPFPRTL